MPTASASKIDESWSMLNVVALSKNGDLVDSEVVWEDVIIPKLPPLDLQDMARPLALEDLAVAEADLAAVASEAASVVAEEVEEEVEASGAATAEAIEVGMVAVADLVSAMAMAIQKAPRQALVGAAGAVAAMEVVVTATLEVAQDTATDLHATATEAAVATESPLEEVVVAAVAATATVIAIATTTASAPTMEAVATTNRANKEGTERARVCLLFLLALRALLSSYNRR